MTARRQDRPLAVLDQAVPAVLRAGAPWLGLLLLCVLPLRLLQVAWFDRLLVLGSQARHHGDLLWQLGLGYAACLLPALLGRAVYVQALHHTLRARDAAPAAILRLAPGRLLSCLYLAAALELLALVASPLLLPLPLGAWLGALALATLPLQDQPGPLRPWIRLVRHSGPLLNLFWLPLLFGCAFLFVALNLLFLTQVVLWLASALAGPPIAVWAALLHHANPLYVLLLWAATLLVLEPFWIASAVVTVSRSREAETGEDLQRWLAALRRSREVA